MTFVHISKLLAFGFIGFSVGAYAPLAAAMVAAGAAGNWVGEGALHRLSEQRFRFVLRGLLTLLALQLLWQAVRSAGA
jgi:uncharacterized membrane protein YfcA